MPRKIHLQFDYTKGKILDSEIVYYINNKGERIETE
jgi:hypothetical protein